MLNYDYFTNEPDFECNFKLSTLNITKNSIQIKNYELIKLNFRHNSQMSRNSSVIPQIEHSKHCSNSILIEDVELAKSNFDHMFK